MKERKAREAARFPGLSLWVEGSFRSAFSSSVADVVVTQSPHAPEEQTTEEDKEGSEQPVGILRHLGQCRLDEDSEITLLARGVDARFLERGEFRQFLLHAGNQLYCKLGPLAGVHILCIVSAPMAAVRTGQIIANP